MGRVKARPARPDPAHVSAVGRSAMISTSHPAATEAGVAALRAGGSAVDAYLAAAAVQTVVEPTMTTLAGTMLVSVYEPSTGQSRFVSDLGTKPAAEDGDLDDVARWSGRTVVRPGWVRVAHAAWERWGRLPWADLFPDALVAAREGFVVDELLWGWAFEYRRAAGITAEGQASWFPNGRLFGVGDVLRQPVLARTIEQLAADGPAYFYRGEFARHFVDTARAAGSRITLDDLTVGEVKDLELPPFPIAGGYELHTSGPLYALLANLAAVGGLGKRGLPDEDPDSLYLLLRMVEEAWHVGLSLARSTFRLATAGELTELVAAVSMESAEKLWPQVESGPPRPFDAMNLGTNAIVAVDSTGMVAHGTHSATSTPFGVGLMVDGVIVPRPITLYANPVVPIPVGWSTSLLAVRDGKPVYASASPSISALQNLLQNFVHTFSWDLDLATSVSRPLFGASVYPSRRPMVEATMGERVIGEVERRGVGLTRVSPWEPEMGSCHAVRLDAGGTVHGVADPRRLGQAAGF